MDNSTDLPLARKEILRIIEEELERGQSKQQVLDDLSGRQQFYSRESLAQIISLVPDPELRRRYEALNRVLFGLLLLMAGLCLAAGIMFFSRGRSLSGGTAFFGSFIVLCFVHDVRQMRGNIYWPLGLLSLAATARIAVRVSTLFPWNLLITLSLGAIAILAFYLGGSLFPHRGFMGIKKDQDGNWLL